MFNLKCINNATLTLLKSEVHPIINITKSKRFILRQKPPSESGCYVFWWINDTDKLTEALKQADYYLKVSHKKYKCDEDHFTKINFTNDWINAATQNICINGKYQKAICLYAGKSTNIKKRVTGHLRLTVDNLWIDLKIKNQYTTERLRKPKFGFGKKPNTVSQLRIGLERVFQENCVAKIINNVGISWLSFDEKDNTIVNRFYIEDKLISDLVPIFNIDAER